MNITLHREQHQQPKNISIDIYMVLKKIVSCFLFENKMVVSRRVKIMARTTPNKVNGASKVNNEVSQVKIEKLTLLVVWISLYGLIYENRIATKADYCNQESLSDDSKT